MKCAICKHAGREMTWQPFGPNENPLSFTIPGSHYRGFPAIPVCGFCQREKIEIGETVYFTHKGIEYQFCFRDDTVPHATGLWNGGEAQPINGQGAPDAIMICRDTPSGHDIVALVEGDRLAELFVKAPRLERSHAALCAALYDAVRELERYDSQTAKRLTDVLLKNA